MKKLLLILSVLMSTIVFGQSTTNPDTVCYQTAGSTYTVPSLGAGYTYTWSGPGVSGDQFCPVNANIGSNTITYTVTQGGCTFSTTTSVTVNSQPVLSPIQHN